MHVATRGAQSGLEQAGGGGYCEPGREFHPSAPLLLRTGCISEGYIIAPVRTLLRHLLRD
jgi:hypothetical protein